MARVPGYSIFEHKIRLYNVTDTATEILGTSTRSNISQTDSCINGKFTIASSKTFKIEHMCSKTNTLDGFGRACGFGTDEIYTTVVLIQIN